MRKLVELERQSRLRCGASTPLDDIKGPVTVEVAQEHRLAKLRALIGDEVLRRFGTFEERIEARQEIQSTVAVHVMTHAQLLEYRRACRADLIDDINRMLDQKRKQ